MHCVGCGAIVDDVDSPAHRYIGASPGCWAMYIEVLAREYGEFRYPPCHRTTVDAYSAQHPGTPSRESIQSVGVHLIGLLVVLERGLDSDKARRAIARAVARSDTFTWLEPPESLGSMTILDVCRANDLTEHERLVMSWGESVWQAWSEHHETVRAWA